VTARSAKHRSAVSPFHIQVTGSGESPDNVLKKANRRCGKPFFGFKKGKSNKEKIIKNRIQRTKNRILV